MLDHKPIEKRVDATVRVRTPWWALVPEAKDHKPCICMLNSRLHTVSSASLWGERSGWTSLPQLYSKYRTGGTKLYSHPGRAQYHYDQPRNGPQPWILHYWQETSVELHPIQDFPLSFRGYPLLPDVYSLLFARTCPWCWDYIKAMHSPLGFGPSPLQRTL